MVFRANDGAGGAADVCRSGRAVGAVAARPESRPVQPAALALHRPRGQPLLGRRRHPRRPATPTTSARPRAASGRPPTAARNWAPIFDDQPVQSIGSLAVAPLRPEHRLGRHRRGQDPQPHLARPGHLQVDRRRQDLDADGARADRPHPAPGRSTRRTPTSCSPARSATPTARSRSAASSARPTAARRGRRTLFVDENTGCSDIAMDPTNPRILFAGMWQLEIHTWGRDERRAGQRPLHVARRRRHVDAAHGPRPAHQAGRQGGGGDRARRTRIASTR